jgi:LasA protease
MSNKTASHSADCLIPFTRANMKGLFRFLQISTLLAVLISSCSTGGVWIPPSSPSKLALREVSLSEAAASVPADAAASSGTPSPEPTLPAGPIPTSPAPEPTSVLDPAPMLATAAPNEPAPPSTPVALPVDDSPFLYYAQAADTLPVLAVRFGVQTSEITSTEPLPAETFLNPGQLLVIPRRVANTTSSTHILPDSEIVFSPSAADFDVATFVEQAGGKLSGYREWLKSTGLNSGAEIVMRVATENSINPRLLLALLEYQGQWVYGQPANLSQEKFPLGLKDPNQDGLYHQLIWAIKNLSIGYYAWREGRMAEIRFSDGVTARLSPELNAGSVALQYYFAQIYQGQEWLDAVDPAQGLAAVHARLFGDPWERARTVEPLFPSGIEQPPMILPFMKNWLWSFSGGPHGAWEHDGAYAALDFAPGSTSSGCVKSNTWATAAASGLVTRSGTGLVVLDMDGDGREQTGWVLIYLHISTEQRAPVGTWVNTGDPLGHPSCEGGVSTGTHVHIARKYNGEWVPADGPLPFNLGGWIAHAGDGAYKGTLTRDGATVTASTSGSAFTFIMRKDEDP